MLFSLTCFLLCYLYYRTRADTFGHSLGGKFEKDKVFRNRPKSLPVKDLRQAGPPSVALSRYLTRVYVDF